MADRRRLLLPGWAPPYPVLLLALGIAVGLVPGLPRPRLEPSLLLGLFVPALVFEGALNLDLAALRRVAGPVAFLATIGVAATIGLVAVPAHLLLGLGWTPALLLGAILAPTDPIAVVAVVRRAGAPRRLAALLEGESLFNDGTGAAAFAAILAGLAGGGVSALGLGSGFLLLAAGGAAAGALVGLAGAAAARRLHRPAAELAVTAAAAYGSYWLAALLGGSGVMAVVVAGTAMAGVKGWAAMTERWWAMAVVALNTVLFLLIGLGLPAASVLGRWPAVLAAFGILLLARLPLANLPGLGVRGRWRGLLWWGGVRGALSVVLALAAVGRPGVPDAVPVTAYGVVALSLLTQGSLVRPALRLLEKERPPAT